MTHLEKPGPREGTHALNEDAAHVADDPFADANADNAAVVRNALVGYVAWTANLVAGFVVTPILLIHLGESAFGAWTLALALAGYVGTVELGLGVATIREVAAALAQGNRAVLATVAASARATYLVMAGIASVILMIIVNLPAAVVSPHGVDSTRMKLVIVILGAGYIFASTGAVFGAIAIGVGRADIGTNVGIVTSLATAAAQAAVAWTTGSLVWLAVVTAVGTAGTNVVLRGVLRRRFRELDVRLRHAERRTARRLLASGWRNGAIGICAAVAVQSDVLVVQAVVGVSAVAAYGIAVRASAVVRAFANRATDVLMPTFAHSTARGDKQRTIDAFTESAFLTRALLVPALIILVWFGSRLLDLWLGSVPPHTNLVLVTLVLAAIAAAPGNSSFVLLTGMNRLSFMLHGGAIAAVANLCLSVAFAYAVGVAGPALGSLLVFIFWDGFFLPRYVAAHLGLAWRPLVAAGLIPLIAPAVAACAVAGVGSKIVAVHSPLATSAAVAATLVTYMALLPLTVGSIRRARYRRLVRRLSWRGRRT